MRVDIGNEESIKHLTSLLEGNIWLAKSNTLNDPYECLIKVLYEQLAQEALDTPSVTYGGKKWNNNILKSTNPKKYDRLSKKHSHKVEKQVDKNCKSVSDQVCIGSLSQRNDSILMWSYYADGHKGLCVEFYCKNILDKYILLPVIYTDKIVYSLENLEQTIIPLIPFVTKAGEWSHEQEWRLIGRIEARDKVQKGHLINIGEPTNVYFGNKIELERKKVVEKIIRGKKIGKKYMRLAKDSFKLESGD